MKNLSVFVMALVILTSLHGSKASASANHCANTDDMNQMEMNMCAGEAADLAETQMQAVYTKAIAATSANDLVLLKRTQSAWKHYRALECEAQGASAEGGSIQPLIISTCMKKLTDSRKKEIVSDYLTQN
jgi:uncharacterized protein YecT (DUF1311 family)